MAGWEHCSCDDDDDDDDDGLCFMLFFLESTFPLTLVFIFGIVGILILVFLIIVSQQHR